jgi:hypothetical protein
MTGSYLDISHQFHYGLRRTTSISLLRFWWNLKRIEENRNIDGTDEFLWSMDWHQIFTIQLIVAINSLSSYLNRLCSLSFISKFTKISCLQIKLSLKLLSFDSFEDKNAIKKATSVLFRYFHWISLMKTSVQSMEIHQ